MFGFGPYSSEGGYRSGAQRKEKREMDQMDAEKELHGYANLVKQVPAPETAGTAAHGTAVPSGGVHQANVEAQWADQQRAFAAAESEDGPSEGDSDAPGGTTAPNTVASVAKEALSIVSGDRRSAYGTPERNFTRIATLWNAHLTNLGIIDGVSRRLHPEDVSMLMLLMKVGRLTETVDHRDSIVDLTGYALTYADCVLTNKPE